MQSIGRFTEYRQWAQLPQNASDSRLRQYKLNIKILSNLATCPDLSQIFQKQFKLLFFGVLRMLLQKGKKTLLALQQKTELVFNLSDG